MHHVDLYCERASPALWAEPLNALTNLAFFLAAWWLWREATRHDQIIRGIKLLLFWLAAFGTGSVLFHTFANTLTRWLDVLPIALFVLTYLCLYTYRVAGLGLAVTAALAVLFIIAAYIGRQFPHILNGSLIYAPTVVLLLTVSPFHWAKGKHEPLLLLAATAVFIAALIFRTIDNAVCPIFPVGTHFLWHLSTALALLLATKALIVTLPPLKHQKRGQ
jgi:Ceramidase